MTQEGRIGVSFGLESFQNKLEARSACMYAAIYISAEYMFALDIKTASSHPRHSSDTFILSYLGRMWNSDPRPSQEHYCMGTVNFWDIANYRKLQESPGHHPAAFRTHCIPHHENMLLGKCCQGEKIFLADEQDISIVICNILSLVKQFEAKEKSVSIRNLDYFSKLSRVRTRGHLIDIVKPFDAVPPVYRSPSPTLQPARDRLEELVSHVKPTVRFNPI